MNDIPKWVAEFIETFVKIEYVEQSECYGHYPYTIASENVNGNKSFGKIIINKSVGECYYAFAETIKSGDHKIVMALDFPQTMDAPSDFIGIFYTENTGKDLSLLAIPYNDSNGKTAECVYSGSFIDFLRVEAHDAIRLFVYKPAALLA